MPVQYNAQRCFNNLLAVFCLSVCLCLSPVCGEQIKIVNNNNPRLLVADTRSNHSQSYNYHAATQDSTE